MSEKKTKYPNTKHYMAAGVFKIDYRAAGYPDLIKIATEWAKDQNFHELIVRGVSERNFGIQFVYISNNPELENIIKYRDELVEKYTRGEGGFYAWDYEEGTSDDDENTFKSMIVLKGITKE